LGFLVTPAGGTITAGTGFTQRVSTTSGIRIESGVQTAAGNAIATWTNSASSNYLAHVLTYKAAAATSQNYVVTVSDGVGLTDTNTAADTYLRSTNDSEAITDVVASSAALARAQSDSEAITDAVSTSYAANPSIGDAAGITDVVTTSYSANPSVSDSAGITDSVTAVLTSGAIVTARTGWKWGEYFSTSAGDSTSYFNRVNALGPRKFDYASVFTSFDSSSTGHSEFTDFANAGMGLLVAWQPSKTVGMNITDIAAGVYDTHINSWITYLQGLGVPIVIRFGHEMNGNWSKWSPAYTGTAGSNCTDPAQFIAAWQYMVNKALAANATNIKWFFCANSTDVGGYTLEQFYPGDSYVDKVGYDIYNNLNGSTFMTPAQTFVGKTNNAQANTYDRVTALNATAPVWIGETGCVGDGDPLDTAGAGTGHSKFQWYQDAFATNVSVAPRIEAVNWFDKTGTRHWMHDSTSDSMSGFVAGFNGVAPIVTPPAGGTSATPTVVQSVPATETAAATTIAIPNVTTTAGNLLQVAVSLRSAITTVTSVADSAGNTWARVGRVGASAAIGVEAWTTTNANPAALTNGTITITFSSSVGAAARFWEINGANNAAPIDQSSFAASSGGTTTPNSGTSPTLAATNDLAFGAIAAHSSTGTPHTYSGAQFTQGAETTSWPSATTGDNSIIGGTAVGSLHSGALALTSSSGEYYKAIIDSAANWAAITWTLSGVPVASTGVNYTVTVTDSVAGSDSAASAAGYSVALNDASSITDNNSTSVSYAPVINDSVGTTDSITSGISYTITVADSVGVTDNRALSANYSLTINDSVGISDVSGSGANYAVTVADGVGTTDSVNVSKNYSVTVSDSVAASDAVQLTTNYNVTLSNAVGLSDNASTGTTINYTVTIADGVGAQDGVLAGDGYNVSTSDSLNIDDTLSGILGGNESITLTERVTISDSVTVTLVNTYQKGQTIPHYPANPLVGGQSFDYRIDHVNLVKPYTQADPHVGGGSFNYDF
jgi:hypothetical protein